jgi:hypothetical protein
MRSIELDDIGLDEPRPEHDDATAITTSRPACLRNVVHEVLFVLVCTFVGASFVFLQRATVILTEVLKTKLGMSSSEVSWITASSG